MLSEVADAAIFEYALEIVVCGFHGLDEFGCIFLGCSWPWAQKEGDVSLGFLGRFTLG